MIPTEFGSLADLVDSAIRSYRLPRWKGQRCYVELWSEKDALSGVLLPLAAEYHVTLVVNKGYSSVSGIYDAARRRFAHRPDKHCVVLYLGDHDPSGLDMDRDIDDRGNGMTRGCPIITVSRVALHWDQVQQYRLPPNPAKQTDSRYAAYVAKYGPACWEVDALPPDVLQDMVRAAIEAHLDSELMDAVIRQENVDKARLTEYVRGLDLE